MRKKNAEPALLTDQEPAKKRGLMRVIELIDRDSGARSSGERKGRSRARG